MDDLFNWTPAPGYPISPGWKEPTTSREAAVKVAPVAKTHRDQALLALRMAWPAGLTADEVAAKLGRRELAIRPRISELKDMGAIQNSNQRRKNQNGMSAIIWVAVRAHGEW